MCIVNVKIVAILFSKMNITRWISTECLLLHCSVKMHPYFLPLPALKFFLYSDSSVSLPQQHHFPCAICTTARALTQFPEAHSYFIVLNSFTIKDQVGNDVGSPPPRQSLKIALKNIYIRLYTVLHKDIPLHLSTAAFCTSILALAGFFAFIKRRFKQNNKHTSVLQAFSPTPLSQHLPWYLPYWL